MFKIGCKIRFRRGENCISGKSSCLTRAKTGIYITGIHRKTWACVMTAYNLSTLLTETWIPGATWLARLARIVLLWVQRETLVNIKWRVIWKGALCLGILTTLCHHSYMHTHAWAFAYTHMHMHMHVKNS